MTQLALGGGTSPSGAPLGDAAVRQPTGQSAQATAQERARRTGKPAEVAGAGSERAVLFANPDGTMTLEQHSRPVRARQEDGGWAPVDTRLARSARGLAPRSTTVGITFSSGGSDPMVRVESGGKVLSMTAPWPLPAPVVDGPRATYRDVLPDVDLVLTAREDGFSEVVVVRTRQAAADPRLDTLRFGLDTSGLRIRGESGGFVAADATGAVVFTSPAPSMWDSSGGAAGRLPDQRADGDRTTRMRTTVTTSEVAVVPDHALLADPATRFPVYLDPSATAGRSEWAMVSSGYGGQEYYKWAGQTNEGVGFCDVSLEWNCNKDQVKRLAWEFTIPSFLNGTHVLYAQFRAYETHDYNCVNDTVELWRVGGLSTATNWTNLAWYEKYDYRSVSLGYGCSGGAGWVEFNATTGAVAAVNGQWGAIALGLRASNETSMAGGWKRFNDNAGLSITYNSVPLVADQLATQNVPGSAALPCVTGIGRPVVASLTPTLAARMRDADTEVDLIGAFEWQRWTGTAWQAVGTGNRSGLSSYTNATMTIPAGQLNDGDVYRWRVQTRDPWSVAAPPLSGTDSSPWSGWCEFGVDATAPWAAPGVSSPVYLQDGNYHGGVGQTADFTFTANGVTDVTGYLWGWADPPTTLAAAPAPGADLTMRITPPPPSPQQPTFGGQATLYVRSVDPAGSIGPITRYSFLLGWASQPNAAWNMDDPAGSAALLDSSGNGRDLTLTSGTAGAPGRLLPGPAQSAATVVSFNGTSTVAATATPVLDTRESFSVSAWVRLTDKSTWRAVLTQDGTRMPGFGLWYATSGQWVFGMYPADADNSVLTKASSITGPKLGAWTHLAAVYDDGANQLALYVDGVLVGTTPYNSTWTAGGPLLVGRARHNGVANNYFSGDIAEVRVWNRVVSAGEIAPLAATQVGRWRLDGNGWDYTAWGRDATAVGGVSWGDGYRGDAAVLDGSTGRLATAGPAIRTDQSFTVAAWVRLTAKGSIRTVAAQDGDGGWASFSLAYNAPADKWVFSIPRTNVASPTWQRVYSTTTAPLDTWVHLVGVYDAPTEQARLYVDGQLQATRANTLTFNGTGTVQIGGIVGGLNDGNFWAGSLDEVRLYAGALPASEITKLYLS